jgi:hypothetical protein
VTLLVLPRRDPERLHVDLATTLRFFKYFRRKILRKNWRFCSKQS